MVSVLIYVLVLAIVFWVLWYVVTNLVPAPLQKPATVVLIVLGAICLIYILLQFAGGMPSLGPHHRLRPEGAKHDRSDYFRPVERGKKPF